MSTSRRARVLCVDDEPMVLQGLRRTLRPYFEVSTATCGEEALGMVREDAPYAALLTDMRMPGMSGAQLLLRARQLAPDTARLLLTGHADLDAALTAVNQGQVFRFLTKPCPPEDLVAALQAGAEQFRLVHAERELLELTLTGAVRALSDLLALSSPQAFGRAARIHRTVAALCARLEPPNRWAIEVAAQLSQIGSVQLPAAVAEKVYAGMPLSSAEQAVADRGPSLADQLLANIPRLEPVRALLAWLAQRGASPGAPAGAPPGAGLLRLAVELDALEASGRTAPEALAALQARPGGHDPAALGALEDEVARRAAAEVQELSLAQLRPGLQLAEDLRSRAGVLLVARGFVVTHGLLVKLLGLDAGVREPIKVVVPLERSPAPA